MTVLGSVVRLVRKVAQMNKVVLTTGLLVVATVVGVKWICECNEPEWARPTVQGLADFSPSNDGFEAGAA